MIHQVENKQFNQIKPVNLEVKLFTSDAANYDWFAKKLLRPWKVFTMNNSNVTVPFSFLCKSIFSLFKCLTSRILFICQTSTTFDCDHELMTDGRFPLNWLQLQFLSEFLVTCCSFLAQMWSDLNGNISVSSALCWNVIGVLSAKSVEL